MRRIDELKYFEARRLLEDSVPVATNTPPFSFSAETRADLERILGPKPELIAALQHAIAPAGFVPGPGRAYREKRKRVMASQWRSLARSLVALRRSLTSLDYDAGVEVETGGDGFWEFEHDRDGTDIDLEDLASHAERVSDVVDWLIRKTPPQRGRPRGISSDRHFFGIWVATTLQRAGVKLTKGRDGVFARTLAILFDVGKLGAPEDMFDCVRSLVQWADAIGKRQERAAKEAAAKDIRTEKGAGTGRPKKGRLPPPKPPVG